MNCERYRRPSLSTGSALEPLISFRNVRKAFGEKVVYSDLNLDIFEGETITIMGGSGVGKERHA